MIPSPMAVPSQIEGKPQRILIILPGVLGVSLFITPSALFCFFRYLFWDTVPKMGRNKSEGDTGA